MVLEWLLGKSFSTDDVPDLTGKVAVITGGTAGLGFASAVAMARKGAHVIVTARSDKRGQGAIEKIKQESGSEKVEYGVMENADLGSVRKFAETFIARKLPIHILLLNAGVAYVPYSQTSTGIESTFFVNHVAHHYLTTLLLPTLTSQQFPSRIVVLSSKAAEWSSWSRPNWDQTAHVTKEQYSTVTAYHLSKLANALFTRELTKRLGTNSKIYVNCLHPGMIGSNITAHNFLAGGYIEQGTNFLLRDVLGNTPEYGALTQLYLCTSEEVETNDFRGRYFVPTAKEKRMTGWMADDQLQAELWDFTEKLVKECLAKS